MNSELLASKLKNARENLGLTQKSVADTIGIAHSAISEWEKGPRQPTLAQLVELARLYRKNLSFFLEESPLLEPVILWRQKPSGSSSQELEAEFKRLVRQYRNLELWTNAKPTGSIVDLFCASYPKGFNEVESLANSVSSKTGLGKRPGESLLRVFQETYGLKVFFLPMGDVGSSASFFDEELGAAVLLNSSSVGWRRNFDLAHEIFHLVTWRAYLGGQSGHVDEECEKYAQAFAGDLLIPRESLMDAISSALNSEKKISFVDLEYISRQFDVSVDALVWRMKSIYGIQKKEAEGLIEKIKKCAEELPKRTDVTVNAVYPVRYIDLACHALRHGGISSKKFLEYLVHLEDQKNLLQKVLEDIPLDTPKLVETFPLTA